MTRIDRRQKKGVLLGTRTHNILWLMLVSGVIILHHDIQNWGSNLAFLLQSHTKPRSLDFLCLCPNGWSCSISPAHQTYSRELSFVGNQPFSSNLYLLTWGLVYLIELVLKTKCNSSNYPPPPLN